MNKGMTILAAGATAAALSAGAAVGNLVRTPKYAELEAIHAGLTQDEVRSIAGPPDVSTRTQAAGGELWIYRARDGFGERAEYDIEFDRDGKVRDTASFDER